MIRSSTASFFYSLNTDIIFPKTLIVNITKALSSSNLGSPMMKMKRIPKTNHNVPKAWFLVLGCNRQDGKGVSYESSICDSLTWFTAATRLEEHILVKVVLNIWNSGTSSQEGEPSIDPGVHKCIRKQKKEEMNARQIPKT